MADSYCWAILDSLVIVGIKAVKKMTKYWYGYFKTYHLFLSRIGVLLIGGNIVKQSGRQYL